LQKLWLQENNVALHLPINVMAFPESPPSSVPGYPSIPDSPKLNVSQILMVKTHRTSTVQLKWLKTQSMEISKNLQKQCNKFLEVAA
jgi:hypothetical protein